MSKYLGIKAFCNKHDKIVCEICELQSQLQTKDAEIERLESTLECEVLNREAFSAQIELLTKCEEIEGVDECSILCYCQGCKNAERIKRQ